MDLNATNLVIQIIIALATIVGIIITVRISNRKERDEYRKILEKFGLTLNKTNERLKNQNEDLLQEISTLITRNETTGSHRDKAYIDFLKAETHDDHICKEHKRLDTQRESYYSELNENNEKIMKNLNQIKENNKTIERNNAIIN